MRLQKKRIAALLLAGAMLFSTLPVNALAVENPDTSGLCEHHPEHTLDCGYTEGVEGTPCQHEHTEDCYTLVTECVHEHGPECYPQESVSGDVATPSDAEQAEPTECVHECSEDSGCIAKELDCQHEHDSECGYAEAVPGTPCAFVCKKCNAETGEPEKDGCICDTPCTEEAVNADCAVCGADGADLTVCKGVAQPELPQQITITEFDPLGEDVANQIVTPGEKLNLPDTLGASGYVGTQDSGGPEHLTIEGVTWEPDQPYDENAQQGAWLFTAVLPEEGYVLLDDVKLPDISVMVEPVNLLANQDNYDIGDGPIKIDDSCSSGCSHTITGSSSTNAITVTGGTHNIILNNVHIDVSAIQNTCALDLDQAGTCTITLQGNSVLKSGHDRPAIRVPANNKVTIKGSGSLEAWGGSAWPGIGRNGNGNIEIQEGIIHAYGGYNAAGIGGSWGYSGGTITISGGTITAIGTVGIGNGFGNSDTTFFSTGTNGKAFIIASSITDQSKKNEWKGVLFIGDAVGKIYGDSATLTTNAEIPADKVLPVEAGKTLSIDTNVTLTNYGTIVVYGTIQGSINNYGTIIVYDTIQGSINNTGIIYQVGSASLPDNISGTIKKFPNATACGDLIVEGGIKDTDYTCSDNVLTVKTGTKLRIFTLIKTTVDKIVIDSACTGDKAANIILDSVDIDLSGTDNACAFEVQSGAVCNLTLAGASTLKSGKNKAGLQIETGAELTITDNSTGKLTADGGSEGGAGIGGGSNSDGGAIIINGGTVSANGRNGGAGIGGGNKGSSGTITIKGGTVSTNGGSGGAGIGGGLEGVGGTIVIDGNAIVTASGNDRGAGIGHGRGGEQTAKITIKGNATVEVSGSYYAGYATGAIVGTITLGGNATITAHGVRFDGQS